MSNATFPNTLLSSSDFGQIDIVLSRPAFLAEAENCKENFGDDFDPEYIEWDLVDGETDIYSTVVARTQDGKTKITTLKAQATWSEANGSFKLEEIDA